MRVFGKPGDQMGMQNIPPKEASHPSELRLPAGIPSISRQSIDWRLWESVSEHLSFGYRGCRHIWSNVAGDFCARFLAGDPHPRILVDHLGFEVYKPRSFVLRRFFPPDDHKKFLDSLVDWTSNRASMLHSQGIEPFEVGILFIRRQAAGDSVSLDDYTFVPLTTRSPLPDPEHWQLHEERVRVDLPLRIWAKLSEQRQWPLSMTNLPHELSHITDVFSSPEYCRGIHSINERLRAGVLKASVSRNVGDTGYNPAQVAAYYRTAMLNESISVPRLDAKRTFVRKFRYLATSDEKDQFASEVNRLEQLPIKGLLKEVERIIRDGERCITRYGGTAKDGYNAQRLDIRLRMARAADYIIDPATEGFRLRFGVKGRGNPTTGVASHVRQMFSEDLSGLLAQMKSGPDFLRFPDEQPDTVELFRRSLSTQTSFYAPEALLKVSSATLSDFVNAVRKTIIFDTARFEISLKAAFDLQITVGDFFDDSLQQVVPEESKVAKYMRVLARPNSLLEFAYLANYSEPQHSQIPLNGNSFVG